MVKGFIKGIKMYLGKVLHGDSPRAKKYKKWLLKHIEPWNIQRAPQKVKEAR